jgi:anti-sigma-K factor RskA
LRAAIVAEDNSLVVNARYDMASQTLQLTRVKGAAAQGRSHALWLVAGRNAPVSLGVLSQEAETVVLVPAEFITSLSSAILVISDEPLGGSPTGAATGPVLAVGPITGT